MKLALALIAALLAPPEPEPQPCELMGNMRFVMRDATYKVYVVTQGPAHAHAELVRYQDQRPGQWRPVDPGYPVAFTVEIATSKDEADFTVRFVEWPRCP